MPISTPVPVTPATRKNTATTQAPKAAGIKIKKIDAYFKIIQISVHIDSSIGAETRLFDTNFAANTISFDRSQSPVDANLQVKISVFLLEML